MPAILLWIQANPQAFKAYLLAVLALLAKVILLVFPTLPVGQWSDIINQFVDLLIGGISLYGIISGTVHMSRGPAPTALMQTSTIIAAIKGPPASNAVAEAKLAAEEVEAQKP